MSGRQQRRQRAVGPPTTKQVRSCPRSTGRATGQACAVAGRQSAAWATGRGPGRAGWPVARAMADGGARGPCGGRSRRRGRARVGGRARARLRPRAGLAVSRGGGEDVLEKARVRGEKPLLPAARAAPCLADICFIFWALPGDVLAAPESALGLDRCTTSLSLSLRARGAPVAGRRGRRRFLPEWDR